MEVIVWHNLRQQKALFWSGSAFFGLCVLLVLAVPYNTQMSLGHNGLIHPLKLAMVSWLYLWTMALLLPLVNNGALVRGFASFAIFVLVFEQAVIMVRAYGGPWPNLYPQSQFEELLFGLPLILIAMLNLFTIGLAFSLKNQKDQLAAGFKASLFYGLLFFAISGFLGAILGAINGQHTSAETGGYGHSFLNWGLLHGDLRGAPFWGMSALQIVPMFGLYATNKIQSEAVGKRLVSLFCAVYATFWVLCLLQAPRIV